MAEQEPRADHTKEGFEVAPAGPGLTPRSPLALRLPQPGPPVCLIEQEILGPETFLVTL